MFSILHYSVLNPQSFSVKKEFNLSVEKLQVKKKEQHPLSFPEHSFRSH